MGALRIQRLEGSRPDGRLCTLNGTDRVQRIRVENLYRASPDYKRELVWIHRFLLLYADETVVPKHNALKARLDIDAYW
jgi:hypothetical protein